MVDMKRISLFILAINVAGCASGREFWTYVIEPPVDKTVTREAGTRSESVVSPHVVKVAYSDGGTATEVQVPVLSSGQQIIIDHKGRPAKQAVALAPLAPAPADKGLEESYVKSGNAINSNATPVSIVKTRAMVQKLVKQGNYSLALEYTDQLLQRYPSHVESMRTRGSILLKMGERTAALDSYRKAQDIEPNAQVQEQIRGLEKAGI